MTVIPALDLLSGNAVRLVNGDYGQEIRYAVDPRDVVDGYLAAGAEWIHVVDLDAARSGEGVNREVVKELAAMAPGRLEVGGGVRNLATAEALLVAGVGRVVMGTALVKDPEMARAAFAALGDRVVAGVDARNGHVATAGWTDEGGLATDLVKQMTQAGARRFIVTDIARDGALNGPNLAFLSEMSAATDAAVIASGGVATLGDVRAVADLEGIEGLIVGRAIFEGRMTAVEAIEAGRSDYGVTERG